MPFAVRAEQPRELLVLGDRLVETPLALDIPLRLIHGTADEDVPWQLSLALMENWGPDASLTLVKGADHRMSTAADLDRLTFAALYLLQGQGRGVADPDVVAEAFGLFERTGRADARRLLAERFGGQTTAH